MKIVLHYKFGDWSLLLPLGIYDSNDVCLIKIWRGQKKYLEIPENVEFIYGKIDFGWRKTKNVRIQDLSEGVCLEIDYGIDGPVIKGMLGLNGLPLFFAIKDYGEIVLENLSIKDRLVRLINKFLKTFFPGIAMKESNYKEWSVNFNGKTIKVSNWWDWKMKGSADLYLDDEHLDRNTDMIANPKKVLLSKYEVSDEIKSIEVFAAGAFKIKIAIIVNGDVVLKDKLSLIDRFANIFFLK